MSNVFFEVMPNWKYTPTVKYAFETVIQFKRRKAEQRKAMRAYPSRVLKFTVTENEKHSLVWNYLISIHASQISMPLYNEPCRPFGSGVLTGETTIIIQNDIYNYYSLRHLVSSIVLIDLHNVIDREILTLTRVNRNTNGIEFTPAIVGAFQRQSSIVFPLFDAYLTNKNRTDMSDTMSKIDLEFTEYK